MLALAHRQKIRDVEPFPMFVGVGTRERACGRTVKRIIVVAATGLAFLTGCQSAESPSPTPVATTASPARAVVKVAPSSASVQQIPPSPSPTAPLVATTIIVAPPPPAAGPPQCGAGYYVNVDGSCVHRPVPGNGAAPPAGASARCSDGTYSFRQHRQGTCSHHGGVALWL
jgi:uncharacterized protein DUF3761